MFKSQLKSLVFYGDKDNCSCTSQELNESLANQIDYPFSKKLAILLNF